MSYKTFFAVCGVLVTVIIAIATYQIFTLPNNECVPAVTTECMNEWQLLCFVKCGGEHVGDWLRYAYCIGSDCVGTYTYYCDTGTERNEYYGTCVNYFHWQCTND